MKPKFFRNQGEFRRWLDKNHRKETKLLVGFYKVNSGKPTLSWSQSVDQALCYGWIDGIRRSIDTKSYCIRFTPRKPDSTWSAINLRKVEELTKLGLMKPAGLAAFEKRKESNSEIYSYERAAAKLTSQMEMKFKANRKAWTYFQSMPSYYRKTVTYWVMSAKREETSWKRLDELIADCAAGRKIKQMSY